MIDVRLYGGTEGVTNGMEPDGTIPVVVHPHPPNNDYHIALPFRQYFTDTGLITGDNDMRVDGSTSPVEFRVNAQQDRDIYLKSFAVQIADASATLSKFGNLTALTNGVQLCYVTLDLGTVVIHDGIQSNYDFVRLAGGQPAYGDGAGAFRASNVVSTAEGYIPFIDLQMVFGIPWGLKLRRGTSDYVAWNIQDDLSTGMDAFDVVAYGSQLIENGKG